MTDSFVRSRTSPRLLSAEDARRTHALACRGGPRARPRTCARNSCGSGCLPEVRNSEPMAGRHPADGRRPALPHVRDGHRRRRPARRRWSAAIRNLTRVRVSITTRCSRAAGSGPARARAVAGDVESILAEACRAAHGARHASGRGGAATRRHRRPTDRPGARLSGVPEHGPRDRRGQEQRRVERHHGRRRDRGARHDGDARLAPQQFDFDDDASRERDQPA